MKSSLSYLILAFACSFTGATENASHRFYVTREWKHINFTWPSEEILRTAIASGDYIPENIIPAGVKYYEDFYYITLPRMKRGVPATLARIPASMTQSEASPALEPFPSWAMNQVGNCNNLQNVQNIEVDAKGMMWIIDGGAVNTLENKIQECVPKLVGYDIKEMRSIVVYQFPEDVAKKNGNFLYDLVVDDVDGGFVYITDNSAEDPGLIVYSVKENSSWKIRNAATMRADPTATQITFNDMTISAPINIAGIALGPKLRYQNGKLILQDDRDVYFSAISTKHLYAINASILRNPNSTITIRDVGLKASQVSGMIMDNQGVLYYGLLGNSAIGRWDSNTPLSSGQKLIAQDSKFIQWPSSLTIDGTGNLTVLINGMHRFISGKLDLTETNFRLISSFVGDRSYIYDDQFYYDHTSSTHGHDHNQQMAESDHHHEMMEHDHQMTESHHNHQMMEHDHQMMPGNNQSTDIKKEHLEAQSKANNLITNLVSLVFGLFIIFL